MDAGQVVQARRRQEFIVNTESLRHIAVVDIELVIQNIFLVHMELFSHQIQEKAVLIERLVQHSQNRLHVDLRI